MGGACWEAPVGGRADQTPGHRAAVAVRTSVGQGAVWARTEVEEAEEVWVGTGAERVPRCLVPEMDPERGPDPEPAGAVGRAAWRRPVWEAASLWV